MKVGRIANQIEYELPLQTTLRPHTFNFEDEVLPSNTDDSRMTVNDNDS